MKRPFNFGAGPAQLPEQVLRRLSVEAINWKGSGMAVAELPHRGKLFQEIIEETKLLTASLLGLPDSFEVMFMQGGARGQNAIIPMNLLNENKKCDHVVTGFWSRISASEALKYANVWVANKIPTTGLKRIQTLSEWEVRPDSSYLHLCANETVDGIEFREIPDLTAIGRGTIPLVIDASSNLFTRKINLKNVGLLYAGAQKNIGIAGLTVILLNKKIVDIESQDCPTICPSVFSYRNAFLNNSCYNTPPTLAILTTKLMLEWISEMGGVVAVGEQNEKKAKAMYDFIDSSSLYSNDVDASCRSLVNIKFFIKEPDLEKNFLLGAEERGLINLKGHPSVGGIRASLYNSMPMEGVLRLLDWMSLFEREYYHEAH